MGPFPITAWAALTLLTFAVVDVSAPGGWLMLLAVIAIPPILLLRLWNHNPSPAMATTIRSDGDAK